MEITLNTPLGTKVYHKDTKIEYKIEKIHNNLGFLKILLNGYWVYANEYLIIEEPKEEIKYPDFSNAKVGDKVWSVSYGWGEIDYIEKEGGVYPLSVEFVKDYVTYTLSGKEHDYENQSLFWNEFEIPESAYKKPLPKLEVDTLVWVWSSDKALKKVRFFKQFTRDGKILAFDDGCDSKTTTFVTEWDNWELYKLNLIK